MQEAREIEKTKELASELTDHDEIRNGCLPTWSHLIGDSWEPLFEAINEQYGVPAYLEEIREKLKMKARRLYLNRQGSAPYIWSKCHNVAWDLLLGHDP